MKSNQKQQNIDKREQEKQRLNKEYGEIRKEWAENFGIPEDSEPEEYIDIPGIGKSLNLFYLPKDVFIERGLKKFDDEQLKVPTGRFQDRNEIYITYHQKFAEALRDTTPQAFEDLREGISSFKALSGNDVEKHIKVIQVLMSKTIQSQHIISSSDVYNKSYIWGSFRLLCLFTYYKSEGGRIPDELLQFNKNETEILGMDLHNQILKIKIEGFERVIQESFQNTATDPNQILSHFLKLQNLIYLWVDRYHLHKDWLINYAYSIISQMSTNEKIPVGEITILPGNYTPKTRFPPFEFKVDGWWASRDEAEDYRQRVTKEFEDSLALYLHRAANSSPSNPLLKITRPKDPDSDSIKWLIAWNEGATNPQIADCFGRSTDTIEDGIDVLAVEYDLPKRKGIAGRKKLLVSEIRLKQIKALEIGGKSFEK